MRAAYAAGLGALVAVVAVLAVPQDPALEGEAAGAAQVSERVLVPQIVPVSSETAGVGSWQAESRPARHSLADMPQNAHAITSSQTQITLKTWSVPILRYSSDTFAVDDDTGDIYAVNGNKVQMIDVSKNTRNEWIIPADQVVEYLRADSSVVMDGKYWFVDRDLDIQRLDPSTGVFTVWDMPPGYDRCFVSLIADAQGNIWCKSYSSLTKLDPEQNQITRVSLPEIVFDHRRFEGHVDSSGTIFALGERGNGEQVAIQINAGLNSAKVWNIHQDRSSAQALYVTDNKAYFMKHFHYRQILGELDIGTNILSQWSLPYQTRIYEDGTSLVVDSKGIVFFEMSGQERELHRFVPETANFTTFDVVPDHLIIDSSDTIYMNLGSAVASAT